MEVSGQLHAPAALPQGKSPGTHWIGGWVGSRAILDAVVKRKISSSRRESNPRTPIVKPVAQRYTDWAITALIPVLYAAINQFEGLPAISSRDYFVPVLMHHNICFCCVFWRRLLKAWRNFKLSIMRFYSATFFWSWSFGLWRRVVLW
jgi:hypothetical protein